MEKKLQKVCVIYYNLLIVQDLWQAHNQILSIIFLKEFIELNINLDTMIKSVKHVELHSPKEFIKNNKLILKTQQRFKSEKHHVFTGEINMIALRSNDDNRMQSTYSTETYAYRTSKDLVSEKEEITCNNKIKQYKK